MIEDTCFACEKKYDIYLHIPLEIPCEHTFCEICITSSLKQFGYFRCRDCYGGLFDRRGAKFNFRFFCLQKYNSHKEAVALTDFVANILPKEHPYIQYLEEKKKIQTQRKEFWLRYSNS